MAPLGEFLRESRIPGGDGRTAQKLTVKLYGRGVIAKETTTEGSPNTKYYRRRSGQFIYSKLDFLNGAFGVVPPELDGRESTLDLPAFDVLPGIDPNWLLAYVTRERFYTGFVDLARGGRKARRVPPEELLRIEVPFPPLPEQRRIAEILSSVDDAIAATQAVIEQTREVKQGVLKRLLTKGIGHTRFKQTEIGEIPETWDIVAVADVVLEMDSGWSPNCPSEPAQNDEWGVLRTSSVTWDGYQAHENKRLPDGFDPRPELQVRTGDVLITRAGPVERTGVISFVAQTPPRLMLSDKIIRMRTFGDKCLPKYLFLFLSGPYAQKELLRRKSGMAVSQTNISQKNLRDLPIALPGIEEQSRIAGATMSVDDTYNSETQRLSQIKKIKSALLSDLLTGRKRVPLADLATAE
jgi:type I restriction enzyme S subunit